MISYKAMSSSQYIRFISKRVGRRKEEGGGREGGGREGGGKTTLGEEGKREEEERGNK